MFGENTTVKIFIIRFSLFLCQSSFFWPKCLFQCPNCK